MSVEKDEVELLLDLKDEMSAGFARLEKNGSKALNSLEKNQTNLNKKTKKGSALFKEFGSALPIAKYLAFGAAAKKTFDVLADSIKVGAEFRASLSGLEAIAQPTAIQLSILEDTARDLGASTAFTAKQATDSFTELAKVGFKTNEIVASSASVLDLAAASGEEMSYSAETMASTLQQFEMNAAKSTKVADVMATSFVNSALDMNRFAESMKYAGPAANAVNETLETTTSYLEILANNAIHGTVAGTALKRVFIDLNSQGSELSKKLKSLGVDAAATTTEKLKALSKAGLTFSEVSDLFGKLSATSAQVLLKNADKIDEYRESLEKADGAVRRMAELKLDNLLGDVTKLKSAWSEMQIAIEDSADGMLRSLTQTLTETLTWWTEFFTERKETEKLADQFSTKEAISDFQKIIKLQRELENISWEDFSSGTQNYAKMQEEGRAYKERLASIKNQLAPLKTMYDLNGKDLDQLRAINAELVKRKIKQQELAKPPKTETPGAPASTIDLDKEKSFYEQLAKWRLELTTDVIIKERKEIEAWYKKQLELYGENENKKLLISDIYRRKLEQLNIKEIERDLSLQQRFIKQTQKMQDEQLALEKEFEAKRKEWKIAAIEEPLEREKEETELWYQEQIEKYKQVVGAKEKIDDEYKRRTDELNKKLAESSKTLWDTNVAGIQQSLSNIQNMGSETSKFFKYLQAASAVLATVDAWRAFASVMANQAGGVITKVVSATAALGTTMGAVSAIKSAAVPSYASSGVVQRQTGTSMFGDRQIIAANPGEMVLNNQDSKRLYDLIKGNSTLSNNNQNQPTIIQLQLGTRVLDQVIADSNFRNTRSGRKAVRGF
jgi:TP901 family phage tail tape measure protein